MVKRLCSPLLNMNNNTLYLYSTFLNNLTKCFTKGNKPDKVDENKSKEYEQIGSKDNNVDKI